MGRTVLKLDEARRVELELMVKRGDNWRERERLQITLGRMRVDGKPVRGSSS